MECLMSDGNEGLRRLLAKYAGIVGDDGGQPLRNGKPHQYKAATRAEHTRHIHLPSALTVEHNDTGEPERVISPDDHG
jgi:hypothetical protein